MNSRDLIVIVISESTTQIYKRVRLTNISFEMIQCRISIRWFLLQGKAHNFDKYNITFANTFNISYEYNSVMQYSGTAFSANGSPTMQALLPNITLGGPNMTAMDIYGVRAFYNCSSSGTPLPSITSTTLR